MSCCGSWYGSQGLLLACRLPAALSAAAAQRDDALRAAAAERAAEAHAAAEIPLLSTFTQIEARPGSSFDHVLYLFHRGALLEPVAVRRGAASDAAALGTLTEGLAGADDIVAAATAAAAQTAETPSSAPSIARSAASVRSHG